METIKDKQGNIISEGKTILIDGRGTYNVIKKDGALCLDHGEKIVPFISKNCTVLNPEVEEETQVVEQEPVEDGLKDPFEETDRSYNWRK